MPKSINDSPLALALAWVAGLAPAPAAQEVRPIPPIGALGAGDAPEADPGTPVEMIEDSNVGRYLRRAQVFLERADYAAAIEILQDVVMGRIVEVVPGRAGEPADPVAEPQEGTMAGTELRHVVFSGDGRLYRPIRRLCHELLASLPEIGIAVYQANYEDAAAELLQAAERDGGVGALFQVFERYFVTLAAGRAMALLADRLMHEGRYRAAVQVLRDLIELYPAGNRRQIGIADAWCHFKIALGLRLAGDLEEARAAILDLARTSGDQSLRILGQLESVGELPQSPLFAGGMVATVPAREAAREPAWYAAAAELVPVWQYRFASPDPYGEARERSRTREFFEMGASTVMPPASRYGPATWVRFDAGRSGSPPQALFLEHFRLRQVDARTGLLLRMTDAPADPPTIRDGMPRVRIAAVDYALLRPVLDPDHHYVVIGHERNVTLSVDVLRTSQLVAYRRADWQRAWSSEQWRDVDSGLRDVIFLAAPTVAGERLLLPAKRRNRFTLECLDRLTGRPLWHTPLHAGGTPFYKPPGCPVVWAGDLAYVSTNAGCIAAVDVLGGDLRWIRRYERRDPRHSTRTRKRARDEFQGFAAQFTEAELPGFHPSDLVVAEGLVIVAPCDGTLVLGLDAASGEVRWQVDAANRFVDFGRLLQIVGATREHLFAVSATHLVCIDLAGGLLRWAHELPGAAAGPANGRGCVAGDWILLPGDGCILVFDANGLRPSQRLMLPPFEPSRAPLSGSRNLVVHGPWLAIGYQGGIEVYSTPAALRALADSTVDPLHRAHSLELAGDRAQAEAVLKGALADAASGAARHTLGRRLLALIRDRSAAAIHATGLPAALRELDGIRDLYSDEAMRVEWHLARLELCKQAGDMRTHEIEQQHLYRLLEGGG